MNENDKNKKAETVLLPAAAPVKTIADHSYLTDFEGWLERELEQLEAAHADFSTAKSNRVFFKR